MAHQLEGAPAMTGQEFPKETITSVILAGGRATRMGGQDKGLIELNGRPMIEYILAKLNGQVGSIIINVNRNQAYYARFGHTVIMDSLNDYQGPLAGILSALEHIDSSLLLTVPCDGPLLPGDLAARLYRAMQQQQADISVAHDNQRMQPVFAMLKADLLPSLKAYLRSGQRKIDRWYDQHALALADFSDVAETFLNVNTPADREALAKRLE